MSRQLHNATRSAGSGERRHQVPLLARDGHGRNRRVRASRTCGGSGPAGEPRAAGAGRQRRLHAAQPRRAWCSTGSPPATPCSTPRPAGAAVSDPRLPQRLLGNTVSVYYLTGAGDNPPVSWADPFYLADSLLILAALLSFPLTRRTRLERWKFALDAAMVLLGGGVAIWYYSVRPTWGAEGGSIVVTVLAFAYPLVSLLLLLGVTTVLLRGPLDGNRRAFSLLVAGVVVSIVADLTFDLVLLQTGGRSAG